MVAGQRIQLDRGYAHQVVTAHLSEDVIRILHATELVTTVPRVTRKEVVVRKSGEHNRRKIVQGRRQASPDANPSTINRDSTGLGDVLSAGSGYGVHPEVIAEVLAAVGDAAVVLSYEEDRAFAAVGLSRFGAVGSTRLDWGGVEVLERSAAFDGAELRRVLHNRGDKRELAVVFWSNLAVPSVALEVDVVATHAETLLDCSPECWIYLTDSRVLIEFQDGEGFTVGRVPA